MKVSTITRTLALAAVVTVGMTALLRDASAPTSNETPPVGSRLQVFVDGVTGELVEPLPGVLPEVGPDPADFVPVEIALDGGGVRIDLDGHFETQVVATVDGHGRVERHCDAEHGANVAPRGN